MKKRDMLIRLCSAAVICVSIGSLVLSRTSRSGFVEHCQYSDAISPDAKRTVNMLKDQVKGATCEEIYEELIQLESLNLVGRDIVDLKPLSDLYQLKHLNLVGNEIENVTPLNLLQNLETLHLSKNKIKSLEPLKLPKLKWLDVHYNELNEVYLTEGWNSLEEFYAARNKLQSVQISGLPQLRVVHLGSNQITSQKIKLHSLPNLEDLRLQDNKLHSLDGLKVSPSFLDVAGNALAKIPNGGANIEILDLSRNDIASIEGIESFANIVALDLSNNPVHHLSSEFSAPKLKYFRAEMTKVDWRICRGEKKSKFARRACQVRRRT